MRPDTTQAGFQSHSPEQYYCYKSKGFWIPIALPPPARLVFLVSSVFPATNAHFARQFVFLRENRTTRLGKKSPHGAKVAPSTRTRESMARYRPHRGCIFHSQSDGSSSSERCDRTH